MSRNSRTLMPASSVSAPRAVEGWTTPSMWWGTPLCSCSGICAVAMGSPLYTCMASQLTTSPSTARASSTASLDLPAPVCPRMHTTSRSGRPSSTTGGPEPEAPGSPTTGTAPLSMDIRAIPAAVAVSAPPCAGGGEGATASPPALLVSVANLFPRNASRKSEPVLDREDVAPPRTSRTRSRARDTSRPPVRGRPSRAPRAFDSRARRALAPA